MYIYNLINFSVLNYSCMYIINVKQVTILFEYNSKQSLFFVKCSTSKSIMIFIIFLIHASVYESCVIRIEGTIASISTKMMNKNVVFIINNTIIITILKLKNSLYNLLYLFLKMNIILQLIIIKLPEQIVEYKI